MIIIMKNKANEASIQAVVLEVESLGYDAHVIKGIENTVIGAVGTKAKDRLRSLVSMEGVASVMPIQQPYKLASLSTKKESSIIKVGNTEIGGNSFVLMGGPCSVETQEQTTSCADSVKKVGGQFLRGGAFKPRTSPYSFQGLEEEGLKILLEAKKKTGLHIVTELLNPQNTELVNSYADVIQIGARNMQNFALLKEVGKLKKPILLKRGLSSTLEELMMSAEYIMSEGNYNVILCERGIRTFEKAYRNVLDLNAVPALKRMTHLPVIVDPSHGTGRKELIETMSKAAIAAGADGIMIEIHPNPEKAFSDGPQSLKFPEFENLVNEIRPYVELSKKTWSVL
ncbi:3-deoxy-7-phosphoheptulonate synthase [bacterium]|jgi:3-deoxy-7-phosphoheptulonate synthase|nr:3-deoxy-7-phosphoheptulonate synthase [bacterium]